MPVIVVHEGPNAFLGRAEAWLLEREALHNLVLGLAYARASEGADVEEGALFATVEEDGEVVGCVLRTPPHKVLVTDFPEDAAPDLVDVLVDRYETFPAVLGPEGVATAIAEEWVGRVGGGWRPGMSQRLYRLDSVRAPEGVAGRLRVASPDDEDLAVAWSEGFARDARIDFPSPRSSVSRWIEQGRLYLWDVDGSPRSVAVASGRTPHGVRVGYVYTPDEHRRSGYASACVAAVSQRLLDEGFRFCVLYTDLENPTSNAIYARVGYEPIGDVRDIDIVPPE